MAFVALDALREGYEVYPVVNAIGGTSLEAHRAGSREPSGWSEADQLGVPCRRAAARLARLETVPALVEIVLTDRLEESPDVEPA